MGATPGSVHSYWVESTPATSFPALEGDVSVDVAIIGGGITGITAATLLKGAGRTVAVVEMKRIARGATGYTTAKVTSGHGLIYTRLTKKFGRAGARTYAAANEAAIDRVRSLVEEHAIDCDLETKANYVYTESPGGVPRIEAEVAAAREAGLAASFVRETTLPFSVAGAIRIEEQAQFHPRKYLLPLAEAIPDGGSHVFEETRALDVRHGDPRLVETTRGTVRARNVVVAAHLPFEDKGLFFAKTHPERSYAVASPIGAEQAPDGMFISIDAPTRSVRTTPYETGQMLIVGGEGHKTGQGRGNADRYERLEQWARERFGAEEFPFRWSTHDYVSVDAVPFVGPSAPWSDGVFIATGYGKWGMTNGTAAAMILADLVLGRPNEWARLFSSRRLRSLVSRSLLSENAGVAKRFVADRLALPGMEALDELSSGEGVVVRVEGVKVGVSRANDGQLVAVSPTCTHLGCVVSWNAAEQTWDCPCHGSRYLPDGTVIEGPAVRDLARREIP